MATPKLELSDNVKSIQAEQLEEAVSRYRRMEQEDVEYTITQIPEDCINCRAGHHRFPVIRPRDGVVFAGKNRKGQRLQRVRCLDCNLVDRLTVWEGEVAIRKGVEEIRWYPVSSRLDYNVRGPNGEQYLLTEKGLGRMAPRQVQGALMTQALRGLSFADVLEAEEGEVLKSTVRPARTRSRRKAS